MWDSLYAILKAGDDGVTVQDEVAFSFFIALRSQCRLSVLCGKIVVNVLFNRE